MTLVPSVVQLGTVVIEGKALDRNLWQAGFYERQRLGRGVYFDPEKLDRRATGLGTLVAEAPAVRVFRGRAGTAVATGPQGAVGRCALNVFLDGELVPWAAEVGLDYVIRREEVAALEIYPRPSDVPLRFAGHRLPGQLNECGAILIWSKPVQK